MPFDFSPKIRKKIIYLDQFVLDFFVKCTRSEVFQKMKEAERKRWPNLLERIDRLTKMQLVVCPYSAIHEDESLTAVKSFTDLEGMYNYLSRGKSFKHYAWIQRAQIGRCFLAWIDGRTEVALEEFMPPRLDVALSDFHEWERVSVRFFQQQTPEKSDEIAGRRDSNAAEMARVWCAWKDATISPDEYESMQLRKIVQAPLDLYNEW